MCRIDLCGQIGVWAQKIYESHFMKMRSLKTALGQFCPTREDNNCCAIIATMLPIRRLAQLHKLARAS